MTKHTSYVGGMSRSSAFEIGSMTFNIIQATSRTTRFYRKIYDILCIPTVAIYTFEVEVFSRLVTFLQPQVLKLCHFNTDKTYLLHFGYRLNLGLCQAVFNKIRMCGQIFARLVNKSVAPFEIFIKAFFYEAKVAVFNIFIFVNGLRRANVFYCNFFEANNTADFLPHKFLGQSFL